MILTATASFNSANQTCSPSKRALQVLTDNAQLGGEVVTKCVQLIRIMRNGVQDASFASPTKTTTTCAVTTKRSFYASLINTLNADPTIDMVAIELHCKTNKSFTNTTIGVKVLVPSLQFIDWYNLGNEAIIQS